MESRAPSAPQSAPQKRTDSLKWGGRTIPMELRPGGWRLRSRDPRFPVCYALKITDLTKAKTAARKWLDAGGHLKEREKIPATVTLADVVAVYKVIPTKAAPETQRQYEFCLKNVIRTAYGKEIEQFPLRDLTADVWHDYMLKAQGGRVLDLTTRRAVNDTLNSQVRGARSIFKKTLWPHYAKRGITFPPDLLSVQWLPKLHKPKPPADDAEMIKAWRKLKDTDKPMWRALGLARFAGLRREELNSIRRGWLVEVVKREKGRGKKKPKESRMVKVDVRDREEEGYWHKVGHPYKAVILNDELAKDLLAVKDPNELLIRPELKPHPITRKIMSRERWFARHLQDWVRPFTGAAKKPLHRLRGLYGDQVAEIHEEAFLARREGVKEAAANLGHASTKTTEGHYLSER